MTGFQCDLYLPEGFSVATDEYGDYLIDLARTTTKRHSLATRVMSDGALRIVLSSMTNATFSGNSGDVLNITVKVGNDIAPGSYNVNLKNIVLTDPQAKRYTSADVTGTIVRKEQPVTVTAQNLTMVYGDKVPTLTYTSEGAELRGVPSLSCEANSSSPVGTYPIVVSKGTVENKEATFVDGTLTITKAPLNIAAGNYTKKQGDAMPEFTLTYTGFKNNETKSILTKQPTVRCEATVSSAPGEYSITVSGAEAQNYEISYTNGKLVVTNADPVKVTAKSYSRLYGEANPTFGYTTEGATLDGEPEIICEATATSPVGEYPIVIRKGGVKNYNDSYVNGVLTITKAPLSVSVGNYTKKQGEAMPEFSLTYTGFKNNETEAVLKKKPTATTTATASSEPGEYDIIINGGEAENYSLSYKNGKLTVVKADAVVVTAKSYSRVYGDANPTFEYTAEGAALEGSPEIICEATATSPVGEYPIIIKKGSIKNYNDSYVNGVLTITQAPLSVSVGNYTKKQGEANPGFVINYSGFKNNETEAVLKTKPTAATSATVSSAPGEYDIVVSGGEAQNYTLSYQNGKLTVVQADAVVVTAKSYTRVYGDANPTFEYTSEGAALEGSPEIICEATATSPVGDYPIIIKKGSVTNYNDTYVNGVLTITKAPLTITAGTYTKKQYDPMPEFSVSYTGFKNNETKDVLTKQPTMTCDANEDSAPGEYNITVSGAEGKNYKIQYVAGKLTVTEPDSYTLTYMVDGEVYRSYSIKYRERIVPLEEPSKEGYTFSGWSEIPETMPAKNVVVTGTFTINSYTITYIVDGNEYKTYTLTYGASVTPETEPTKEGYTFSGWSWIPKNMPAEDVVVTGTFVVNSYTLTYMVDGEVYKTENIDYGTAITPEAEPTKEGYTFSGWSWIPKKMPAEDVTVTGTFKVNSYTVTFMYGDEVLYTEKVNYGDPIPLPNILDKYGFVYKWLDVPETMPAHDVVLQVDETDMIESLIPSLSKGEGDVYDLNGRKLSAPQKGINIIRMSDGTTRKVMIK